MRRDLISNFECPISDLLIATPGDVELQQCCAATLHTGCIPGFFWPVDVFRFQIQF